jgi:hypothetical protein
MTASDKGKPKKEEKPTVEYPQVPTRAEGHNIRSMSELCLPVFDLHGGPIIEPPKK